MFAIIRLQVDLLLKLFKLCRCSVDSRMPSWLAILNIAFKPLLLPFAQILQIGVHISKEASILVDDLAGIGSILILQGVHHFVSTGLRVHLVDQSRSSFVRIICVLSFVRTVLSISRD